MGEIRTHPPVKLIVGLTYINSTKLQDILRILEETFSSIEVQSEPFSFSDFTSYYQKEMGDNLKKVFLVFARLINPEELPDIKIMTNELELRLSEGDARQINIDPGYVSEAKLVLATTKNYAHRIYLKKGIFGDVHLSYTNHSFQKQPWTYPDYQQADIIDFFNNIRQKYMHQLGEMYSSTYEN